MSKTKHNTIPKSLSNYNQVGSSSGKQNREKISNSNHKVNTVSSEHDFSKIARKFDYDLSSRTVTSTTKKLINNEMKLFNMQHTSHNVDLVNFAYINKVRFLIDFFNKTSSGAFFLLSNCIKTCFNYN